MDQAATLVSGAQKDASQSTAEIQNQAGKVMLGNFSSKHNVLTSVSQLAGDAQKAAGDVSAQAKGAVQGATGAGK